MTDGSPTGNVVEQFNAFVHGPVGVQRIALELLGVDGRQRVFEPVVMPTKPIRGGCPQIFERLKVLDKLLQPIVL